MARLRRTVHALCFVLSLGAFAGAATAQIELPADVPILFQADEVTHDREFGITRASGNVEISHGDRILLADTVSYNQRLDVLTASGHVALVEPGGEVLFAEHVELTGDLKSGIIKDLRAILADGARFAAAGGRRTEGNVTEMSKAVYSPCDLCPEAPSRPPLWQLKAVRVVHDQRARRIEYEDAWLEFAGVPVAYTPYLSHPDPTVKRKSGFLAPSIGNSSDLGFIFALPFYWVIDDSKDATITPIYTSNENVVLSVEYRQRMLHGALNVAGSATEDSTDDFRGHVFSDLRYDLDETWRMGLDFNRTTDDTYLRRYRFANFRTLTSRAFAEGFWERDYAAANAYLFQSLEDGVDQDGIPVVLPLLGYNHVGRPDRWGGRLAFDLDVAALTRQQGTDTQRASGRAAWEVPLRDSIGGIYTLGAALWADGYHVGNAVTPGKPDTFTGVTGRIWPQAYVEWRMPFVRDDETFSQVIQPVVQFVASPVGGNAEEIPNEDSQDVELNENNVISIGRFPGLDQVEGGLRANYGLEWQIFRSEGGNARAFFGQSYRFHVDNRFTEASGLDGDFSDIVGDIEIVVAPWASLRYRTRIHGDDFKFGRNELSFGGGIPALRVSGAYVSFAEEQGSPFPGREEFDWAVSSQVTRYWRGRVFGTNDLSEGGGQLVIGVGVTYEDECFIFDARFRREEFRDRDLEPSDSFLFRLTFKTLGDVGFGL